jgi:dTDP-4-amino-4,6-dideoxygalactose transaminase
VISISRPVLGELEEKLVLEVLRSGRLAQGPMVERFEAAVAEVVGCRHAIAVHNGTSALMVALLAHGIGPGDEVVTSPFTFVATLNAILHAGATPVFADIGEDFNVEPDLVEAAIGPSTRAVLPVHLYGQMADMERIADAIGGRDVVIVEDAAQALGASRDGRAAGAVGTGCFSFYATKNVTTGEGGVLTTDDDQIASSLRVFRNQGQHARYAYERPGFNLRMTELQAAVGVAQMSRLPDIVEARRDHARALSEGLQGIDGLVLPIEDPGAVHVFHQYTVRVTEEARLGRDELAGRLEAEGVGCGVYYPRPVYDYPCFRRDPRVGDPITPNAERAAAQVLSLPVHPGLTEGDLGRVVDAIRGLLG